MTNFGLKLRHTEILKEIFSKYKEVKKVIMYGSRAKGTSHDRSDVDLVISNSDIDRHLVGKLINDINESDFPYAVDLQILESIKNEELKNHIHRVGQVFYEHDEKTVFVS